MPLHLFCGSKKSVDVKEQKGGRTKVAPAQQEPVINVQDHSGSDSSNGSSPNGSASGIASISGDNVGSLHSVGYAHTRRRGSASSGQPSNSVTPLYSRRGSLSSTRSLSPLRSINIFRSKQKRDVFGKPLDELPLDPVSEVPQVLVALITYIEINGTSREGLFRVSGKKTQMDALRAFVSDDNINAEALLELNDEGLVDSVAGLIKAFLRELPSSVIPPDVAYRLISVHENGQTGARLSQLRLDSPNDSDAVIEFFRPYRKALALLPPRNYNTLCYVAHFLNVLCHHEVETKMNASNLAIVFGPNLFGEGEIDLERSLGQSGHVNGVLYLFITEFDAVFPEGPLSAQKQPQTQPDGVVDTGPAESTSGREDDVTVGDAFESSAVPRVIEVSPRRRSRTDPDGPCQPGDTVASNSDTHQKDGVPGVHDADNHESETKSNAASVASSPDKPVPAPRSPASFRQTTASDNDSSASTSQSNPVEKSEEEAGQPPEASSGLSDGIGQEQRCLPSKNAHGSHADDTTDDASGPGGDAGSSDAVTSPQADTTVVARRTGRRRGNRAKRLGLVESTFPAGNVDAQKSPNIRVTMLGSGDAVAAAMTEATSEGDAGETTDDATVPPQAGQSGQRLQGQDESADSPSPTSADPSLLELSLPSDVECATVEEAIGRAWDDCLPLQSQKQERATRPSAGRRMLPLLVCTGQGTIIGPSPRKRPSARSSSETAQTVNAQGQADSHVTQGDALPRSSADSDASAQKPALFIISSDGKQRRYSESDVSQPSAEEVASMRARAKVLHAMLKTFQSDFAAKHGRRPHGIDLQPVAAEVREYKALKARIKAAGDRRREKGAAGAETQRREDTSSSRRSSSNSSPGQTTSESAVVADRQRRRDLPTAAAAPAADEEGDRSRTSQRSPRSSLVRSPPTSPGHRSGTGRRLPDVTVAISASTSAVRSPPHSANHSTQARSPVETEGVSDAGNFRQSPDPPNDAETQGGHGVKDPDTTTPADEQSGLWEPATVEARFLQWRRDVQSTLDLKDQKRFLKKLLADYEASFSKYHGCNPSKEDKLKLKAVYVTYRDIKRAVAKGDQNEQGHSGSSHKASVDNVVSNKDREHLSASAEDTDRRDVKAESPVAEGSPQDDHIRLKQLKREKKHIQRVLYDFQTKFCDEHGHSPHTKEERASHAAEYARYKEMKNEIARLEQSLA